MSLDHSLNHILIEWNVFGVNSNKGKQNERAKDLNKTNLHSWIGNSLTPGILLGDTTVAI